MSHRNYMRLVTLIFAVIGVLHLYRAIKGFDVVLVNIHIGPGWSWIGAIVALFLAYQGYVHTPKGH